jgi:WD40 repeat protein
MASFGGTLRLWDMNTLTAEPVILPGHAGIVDQLTFSPDGRWLGATSDEGFARIWDVTNPAAGGKVVLSARPFHPVALAFSPDGQWLATAGCDQARNESECAKGAARLLPVASLTVETEPVVLTSPGAEATVLAFSPNGSSLAVGSSDRSLRLWEAAQPFAPPRVLLGSTIGGGISQLVFSPNAEWLAADAGESGVQVWELANPSAPVVVDPFSFGVPAALAFSPDGHWLAQATSYYSVRLWQVGQWETPPAELSGHISHINPMTFSPDSRWLASGDFMGEVRLWDMTDLAVEPAVLRGDDSQITAMAFSPDAHWLAVITYGREHSRAVQLWAVDNPTQPPIVLSEHASDLPLVITYGTDHLAFSQGGRRLAATGCDAEDAIGQCTAGVVRVWDVPNWEAPAAVVLAHESAIWGLALSPDGNWLVTAGSDQSGDRAPTSNIRLWDTTNPVEPVTLPSSARVAHSVAFSPDGSLVTAAGCEQVAAHGTCITGGSRLWHLRLDDLIDLACRKAGRNLTRSEWEQFFPRETYRKTCDQWPVGE